MSELAVPTMTPEEIAEWERRCLAGEFRKHWQQAAPLSELTCGDDVTRMLRQRFNDFAKTLEDSFEGSIPVLFGAKG